MYARIFGILSITSLTALTACGGGGAGDSNPVTGASDDDVATATPGTIADPNDQSTNTSFVFDQDRQLTANQFTYQPGATPADDTIVINNLPFDNVSSEDGTYTPRAGVVLPTGQVFDNAATGASLQYLAVVQVSGTTGALIGAVATDGYAGFGYGGAYASRNDSGLPPDTSITYRYTGTYNGVRVIRQVGTGAVGANNVMQLTTGNATVLVDLRDIDEGGAVVGSISSRRLYDTNGNFLGNLSGIGLSELITAPSILTADNTIAETGAGTVNSDGTAAQSGTYSGMFSGPNGEEIIGLLVIEGNLADSDPNHDPVDGNAPVTGREVGGFIATR